MTYEISSRRHRRPHKIYKDFSSFQPVFIRYSKHSSKTANVKHLREHKPFELWLSAALNTMQLISFSIIWISKNFALVVLHIVSWLLPPAVVSLLLRRSVHVHVRVEAKSWTNSCCKPDAFTMCIIELDSLKWNITTALRAGKTGQE